MSDQEQPKNENPSEEMEESDMDLDPGEERHLPHEAWHVVQQKQGRVRPSREVEDESDDDSND